MRGILMILLPERGGDCGSVLPCSEKSRTEWTDRAHSLMNTGPPMCRLAVH